MFGHTGSTGEVVYSKEAEKYREVYDALVEAERDIDEVSTKPGVYQRRHFVVHGLKVLDTIRTYNEDVPEEVRVEFGFDTKGLNGKLQSLFS